MASDAGRAKSPETQRAQALAGLDGFRHEAATLRSGLRRYERALERVCRQVGREVPLHQVMAQIGVGELRADLVERLTRFEEARHRMRVACFRMSLTEGLSIGDLARLWGISRQLASRLVHEAAEVPASDRGQTASSDLPPRLREIVDSATRKGPD